MIVLGAPVGLVLGGDAREKARGAGDASGGGGVVVPNSAVLHIQHKGLGHLVSLGEGVLDDEAVGEHREHGVPEKEDEELAQRHGNLGAEKGAEPVRARRKGLRVGLGSVEEGRVGEVRAVPQLEGVGHALLALVGGPVLLVVVLVVGFDDDIVDLLVVGLLGRLNVVLESELLAGPLDDGVGVRLPVRSELGAVAEVSAFAVLALVVRLQRILWRDSRRVVEVVRLRREEGVLLAHDDKLLRLALRARVHSLLRWARCGEEEEGKEGWQVVRWKDEARQQPDGPEKGKARGARGEHIAAGAGR